MHVIKGSMQYLADRHAFFQNRMLIQIADGYMAGPCDLAGIWHDLTGNNVEERGFSFAISTDQPDMLAFKQAERRILQNLACSKSMGYVFNGQ